MTADNKLYIIPLPLHSKNPTAWFDITDSIFNLVAYSCISTNKNTHTHIYTHTEWGERGRYII